MALAVETIRAGLAAVVGDARVSAEETARAAFRVDGMTPEHVVYPSCAEHAVEVLEFAGEQGLGVIPCRNATKLGIGNPPRRYDLALCLKELNRVWHYEPEDLTVSVEAGMKFGDFQHFVGRHGLWLPLDPPGGSKASLGGIVATNAAGPLRLRYGSPRDMVLGMRVATADGKLVKTGGRVVKNVAGYDLGKLFIGSHGTLGVVVEINLKLFPLPERRATFVFEARKMDMARKLRQEILLSPLEPLRMVLLDAAAASLVRVTTPAPGARGFELWLEVGGSERVIKRGARDLESLGQANGATVNPIEAEQAENSWLRISDVHSWMKQAYPDLVILKAILPIAASEEFVAYMDMDAGLGKIESACFAQVGIGIVHVCVLDQKPAAETSALVARVRRFVGVLGGDLVIECCSAEVKRLSDDVWGARGDDFAAMAQLKTLMDPKGVLAPGRFLGLL